MTLLSTTWEESLKPALKPRVFISYTWWTPEQRMQPPEAIEQIRAPWLEQVKGLADRLRKEGVDCRIDQYYANSSYGFELPDDWRVWAKHQIQAADTVLLVCSPGYAKTGTLSSWDVSCMEEDLGSGLVEQRKFIPIGFGPYEQNARYAPVSVLGQLYAGSFYYDVNLHATFGGLLRRIRSDFRKQHPRTGVFISYSHKDRRWFDLLNEHLSLLKERFAIWTDQEIKPGDLWHEEVQAAIVRAKVAVLLVTQAFLASPYIRNHELTNMLSAAKDEGLVIFWIPVASSSYKDTEIAQFQSAHPPDKPLDGLSPASRGKALVSIARSLGELLASSPEHPENAHTSTS